MAFIDPAQDPENQDENQSQVDQALQGTQGLDQSNQSASSSSQPDTSSGGAGGVVSGGTQAASGANPAPSSGKQTSSGSWVNLNKYLDANQDQGAGIGKDIAGTVDNLGSQAKTDIDTLGTNFNAAVQNNAVKADAEAVNKAITSASGLQAGQTLDDDTYNSFMAQKNASYKGPSDVTGFDGYSKANKSLNDASTAVNQTGSEAGRNTLLQNQYKNASANGYTQGENNLDQLLLGTSVGGRAALEPLQSKWGNLSSALGSTVTSGNTAAQQAQSSTSAAAKAAQDAAAQAQANYEQNLNKTTADQWKNTQALIAAYRNQTSANNLTPEQMAAAGLTTGQKVYNTNLKDYINATNPTVGSAATLDQYAQDAALSKLAGGSGILNDPSLAGTANFGLFDKSLTPALANADAAYKKNYDSKGMSVLPIKMPNGAMQDINQFFGDTGGNGISVNNAYLDKMAKDLGGLPGGASPSDLENKWLPALQQLDASLGGRAGNRGYATQYEYMIDAIQRSLDAFRQQQGVSNIVAPPMTDFTAHPRGPARV